MSDQDDRKSMDDVLASIRRIVRAEKDPSADAKPDDAPAAPEAAGPQVDTPPPPAMPKEPPAVQPAETPAAPASEGSPLALTPDMRRDDSETAEDSAPKPATDGIGTIPTDNAGAALANAATAAVATRIPAAGDTAPPIDPSDIREIVVDVLREELAAGGSAAEAIRGIIREELMAGEIGQNISQNVMTLIQTEVGKALNK